MRVFMICVLHEIFGWSKQKGWHGQSKKMKAISSFKMLVYIQWYSVTFIPEYWMFKMRSSNGYVPRTHFFSDGLEKLLYRYDAFLSRFGEYMEKYS
jgi:hypothetical protein